MNRPGCARSGIPMCSEDDDVDMMNEERHHCGPNRQLGGVVKPERDVILDLVRNFGCVSKNQNGEHKKRWLIDRWSIKELAHQSVQSEIVTKKTLK